MKRLIIVGSPRANGRCAHLGEMLFETCIDECPEDELYLAPVSELDIAGCIACDACKRAGERAAQARLADAGIIETLDGVSVDERAEADDEVDDELPIAYCPRFDDDMLELYDVLSDADELIVVSPVFFSGAPAGLTALLDRLQPFFWEWLELRASGDEGAALAAAKRPATLHVVGEGLDKNGYSALVGKVRSALAPAGFVLERVLDWVGKIEPDGTIEQEAVEYRLPPLGVPLVAQDAYLLPADMADGNAETRADDKREANGAGKAFHERPMTRHDARPKLDLGGGNRNVGSKNGGKGSGAGSKNGSGKGNTAGSKAGSGKSRNSRSGNKQTPGAKGSNRQGRNAKGGKRHG